MKHILYINWSDLTESAKDEMVTSVKEAFVATCKVEGEEFLTRSWGDEIKPKTWVEAYVRMYDIDEFMWRDYLHNVETLPDEYAEPDWQEYFDEWVDEQLRDKLTTIISQLPVEAEI